MGFQFRNILPLLGIGVSTHYPLAWSLLAVGVIVSHVFVCSLLPVDVLHAFISSLVAVGVIAPHASVCSLFAIDVSSLHAFIGSLLAVDVSAQHDFICALLVVDVSAQHDFICALLAVDVSAQHDFICALLVVDVSAQHDFICALLAVDVSAQHDFICALLVVDISQGAVVSFLSDKCQFPSFLRTIPSDSMYSLGLVRLLLHFEWTWIGIIASADDYGQAGSQKLKTEITAAGSCVAFLETVPKTNLKAKVSQIMGQIQTLSVNVIVVYVSKGNWLSVADEISLYNTTRLSWIFTGPDCTISNQYSRKETWNVMNSTISLARRSRHLTGYREFLYNIHPTRSPGDIFVVSFWEKAFGCTWQQNEINKTTTQSAVDQGSVLCTGKEKLQMLGKSLFDELNFISYRVYNSVNALAQALNLLLSCENEGGPFLNTTCADINYFKPWQLLHYLKYIRIKNKADDEIFFDENGDPPPLFDIVNQRITQDGTIQCVKVGEFDLRILKDGWIKINDSAIIWKERYNQIPRSLCCDHCTVGFRKAAQPGQPVCCYDCVPCSKGDISNQTDASGCLTCEADQWPNEKKDKCIPKFVEFLSYEEPLGATLAAVAVCGFMVTALILCIFIKNKQTPIVKANNCNMSYLLLLALMLCFLSSLIFLGYPTKVNCMLRQVTFGIIFSLCVSCILAKTMIVVIAFNAKKPGSKLHKWLGSGLPNATIIMSTIIQIMICVVWLIQSPPFAESVMNLESGKIVAECNEGTSFAFWCMLGYLGFLSIVSFTVAFLARNLPDAFNEAKLITFSMLVFVSVWLTFIPAYLSTKGKYMVAVEIFGIISSSTGILGCIFFPKCYIILVRPERNTREHLVEKRKC
ncbi:vomeronasal type-2 receptor 1-like [Protopterus annectens]|uniref:vomeronasal type-2 receptor 1-like n=1 Tax=Protopterus annectens TaxID=7888 RepID=UPI001CFA8BA5|nr:vomeronasal type-2 receptor 1-like [Protopterus annectens]